MKRLGFSMIVVLMLLGTAGGFLHPERSLAATVVASHTMVMSQASIFSNPLTLLQPENSAVDKYLYDLIRKARDTYTNSATASQRSGENNVKKEYIDALNAALSYINNNQTNPLAKDSKSVSVINALTSQINTEIADQGNLQVFGNPTASSTSASNATKEAAGVPPSDLTVKKCTSIWNFSITDCIDAGFTWFIKATFLNIAGFLVWLSANMLNLAIQVGVLDFAKWAPPTLYPVWIIVRQIISLFVVFSGLWLGFMYIIGRDDKFAKYMPWVVIFALFVNFSYPLTRTLIDVSNVISLNIYASAVGSEALTTNLGTSLTPFNGIKTPGTLIMERLGLSLLVNKATLVDSSGKGGFGQVSTTAGALAAVAFVLYAAYIFFMATWILISRTAILVFLTIASPLLFVDSVIPALGERAAKLRTLYFEQLAVAPVFMVMLALTLKFLEVFQGPGGPLGSSGETGQTLASAASGSSASIAIFFNIMMMLIMLHITLKVTTSVAGSTGNYLGGMMGTVGGFALGAAAGGTGLLARGTLGRAAAAARDSSWVTNNQNSIVGRSVYGMTNSMAKSAYDVRNVGVVSKGMATAGMGMGKGGALGYDTEKKANTQDATERYGRIKTINDDGTINQAGAAAKQRFFGNAGGAFANRQEIRDALLEKDKQEAMAEKKIIDKYENMADEKKKRDFYLDQAEDMQKKLRDLERSKEASSEEGKLAQAIKAEGELDRNIKSKTPSNSSTTNIADAQASVEGLAAPEPTLSESQARLRTAMPEIDILKTDYAQQLRRNREEKQKRAAALVQDKIKSIENTEPSAEELAEKMTQDTLRQASSGGEDGSTAETKTAPQNNNPAPEAVAEEQTV